MPVVSIIIPCYNQPHLLGRCLQSILAQTFTDFEIILVDDGSTISYEEVLQQYADVNIKRQINKINLGAVPNMIYCIHLPVQAPYKIVFHEDDIMHPQLLQAQIEAFNQHPQMAWAGTNMGFFKKEDVVCFSNENINGKYFKNDMRQFVINLLMGQSLSLASVMYNCNYTEQAFFDLEKYSMLGDRQMLIELGKNFGCVHINNNLVYAYDHAEDDYRWKTLKKNHILNFYKYIKSFLTNADMKDKNTIAAFTRAIVENSKLLPDNEHKNMFAFFVQCYKQKLISLKYLLLQMPAVRSFADKIFVK